MKTAIYPGSFNPWHDGHQDVLNKALAVFDKVIVAQGLNPAKSEPLAFSISKVEVVSFTGLLKDFINNYSDYRINAIIKGIRNSNDFEYEKTQQYWNEDLGIVIPTIYFISDRSLVHVSSSAIRQIDVFKK